VAILPAGRKKGAKPAGLQDGHGHLHFTVFDCFDGSLLEYFKKAARFAKDLPDKLATQLRYIVRPVVAGAIQVFRWFKRLDRIAVCYSRNRLTA
jgi:hypothetical protein